MPYRHAYKSNTLKNSYQGWAVHYFGTPHSQGKLTKEEVDKIKFADDVFRLAEQNYDCGGDAIVECFGPVDIIEQFWHKDSETSFVNVKEFCKLKLEQALNCREGTDSDPEVAAMERFRLHWKDFQDLEN